MSASTDLEYAIKKDVRNNPIIREADTRQHREFTRTAAIWALIVVMFLFAAWQHASVLQNEYQIERLLQQRAAEEGINRRLRLQVETLRAPQRIEAIATGELQMVPPSPSATLVVERVVPATADTSVVASAAGRPAEVRR